MNKQITRRSAGTEHRRYIIWRGFDFADSRIGSFARSFWTGCGWSHNKTSARVSRSDAEVRHIITQMEADGLSVNAEAL